MDKPTAEEIVANVLAQKAKIRDVFGSGAGKELLEYWTDNVSNGKLFYDDERTTAYAIGQRDFIIEIQSIVNGEYNRRMAETVRRRALTVG